MIHLIDDNFNQHARRIPALNSDMQVYETPNITYVDSNLPCDTFNVIHLKDGAGLKQKELAAVLRHFEDRQLPYCCWVNEEQLKPSATKLAKLGLQEQGEELGMMLDLTEYQEVSHEGHSEIKLVTTAAEVMDYAQVISENWTPPDPHILNYYAQTAAHYLSQRNQISLLVYRHEGQPVATLELFPTNEKVIGIYGVSTKAAYRKRGIASALLTKALNLAKERGYQQVVLQATAAGAGVYRKHGFKTLTKYFEYA